MSARTYRSLVVLLILALGTTLLPAAASAAPEATYSVREWLVYKRILPNPPCQGGALLQGPGYFTRSDCGYALANIDNTKTGDVIKAEILGPDGTVVQAQTATFSAQDGTAADWRINIVPDGTWPSGELTIRVVEVKGETGNFGERGFFLNYLGADVATTGGPFRRGQDIPISGTIYQLDETSSLAPPAKNPVAASFKVRAVAPDGDQLYLSPQLTAASNGTFSHTVPGSATNGVQASAENDYRAILAIEVVDASYTDASGAWAAKRAGAGQATVIAPPSTLIVENSYVSPVGWVKPGDPYTFRVFVKNFTADSYGASQNVTVTIPIPDGTTYTQALPGAESGVATFPGDGTLRWTVGFIPPAAADGTPVIKSLLVLAETDTAVEDPEIVWKNLSSTATLTYLSAPAGGLSSTSLGPKVIPPNADMETARYGFRPFPVVPVDYRDRTHRPNHTGEALSNKINSPDVPGSTYNLFQEMSYGQLSPHGTVPSAGIATADWDYEPGFDFSDPSPGGACHGTTIGDVPEMKGSAAYPDRIRGGWYQLPGDTQYYGGDQTSFGTIGSALATGVIVGERDNACGPRPKAVYDAAQIADPEIDYSDYDTDKDGVVDFFMMVFVGCGGNGPSQLSPALCPDPAPYDNIWPHSWTLESTYFDEETGLRGYISDDQLKDLQGRPLFYTDDTRSQMTTDTTDYPVYVRVGPYNVNPETAIDKASVISHEYGHSLGLPDFYSGGGRETYGTWNLMATDHSQHMDIFGRQEMGWVVPRVLEPGQTVDATGWEDGKKDTHEITWERPDGTPYTLSGPNVHNGEAYVAKLPGRQILDPAKFESGGSPSHVWWSTSGNDYACPPGGGHNLDVALPELQDLPADTEVKVTFESLWDIEWDYDFGFVMVSTDGGESYRSLPSENGYTSDPSHNKGNTCQTQYGNGITGSSGSYEDGTQELDRLQESYPESVFLEDEYDLSEFAGENTVLRFAYTTDGGVARPGWFIDDLKITADDNVIYESDFEGDAHDPRLFPGGCTGEGQTAKQCTDGWQPVDADSATTADHAYYLEMRDRSGFDYNGKGEDDRGDGPTFGPGLSVAYTDEAHGYGNVGTDDPPAQSVLDSKPQPKNSAPNLDDAAWTAEAGDNTFSDAPPGHVDNYEDPRRPDELWRFDYNCLSFSVDSMSGEEIGPETVPPFDLTGDVTLRTADGCAPFHYGHAGQSRANLGPTAVAQARPTSARVGETVAFHGSGSFDDVDAPDKLAYEWDFDGDGRFDAQGEVARHAYERAGTYEAKLRVTDLGGLTDTDTVTIVVETLARSCTGGGAVNELLGTPGDDVLRGGPGPDFICGLGGNDVLLGRGGKDVILGGSGNDKLRGARGADVLVGESGIDLLAGGKGRDLLRGGADADRLRGGGGNDRLAAGSGKDRVGGGPGKDRCRGAAPGATGTCERRRG